ncbi:SAC3 family protein C [Glycine soja]|uniref:SAC3 family protein C n=1 Tax=Glycine soja TaxID=3848 RepID=A0A445GX45_GLYSO|nr:SAC3 family protein C [Glycine soja]
MEGGNGNSGSRTSTSVLSDTEEEEVQPSSNFVGTCPYMCPELQCWILYDGMSLLVRLVKNERVGLLPIGVGSGRRGGRKKMMQTSKESLKSADGKKLFYLRVIVVSLLYTYIALKESGSSVKNCEIWQFLRGYMEILENRPQLLLSRRYGQTTLPYYLLSIAAERHPSATDTCVAARFRVAAGAATIAAERRGLRSGFSCRYFEALVVLNMRPITVLEDTLNYLLSLLESKEHSFEVVHDFIFDRTRSIRQDITMQNIVNKKTIYMYKGMV